MVRLEAERDGAIVSADPHISHLAKIPPGLNGSALALPSVEGATSRPAPWPTSTSGNAHRTLRAGVTSNDGENAGRACPLPLGSTAPAEPPDNAGLPFGADPSLPA